MKAARRKVLHPDFLGAHRYTTARGGIVRPAGGGIRGHSGPCRADIPRMSCTLRTAVACLRQSKGDSPLRCAMHTYPVRYCHGS